MKDTDEKYLTFARGMYRHESEDADGCFAEKNLALSRTWTTEQRRLEYASVQFELDDGEKHERFMDIKLARQTIQYDENENEIYLNNKKLLNLDSNALINKRINQIRYLKYDTYIQNCL